MVMFNPEIIKKSGPYEAEEGCLSLTGTRTDQAVADPSRCAGRTSGFRSGIKTFTGWTAEIIQHEIDHCEGIII